MWLRTQTLLNVKPYGWVNGSRRFEGSNFLWIIGIHLRKTFRYSFQMEMFWKTFVSYFSLHLQKYFKGRRFVIFLCILRSNSISEIYSVDGFSKFTLLKLSWRLYVVKKVLRSACSSCSAFVFCYWKNCKKFPLHEWSYSCSWWMSCLYGQKRSVFWRELALLFVP